MHSCLTAVGLFALTFLSPGPNLLVVVQSSLSAGRRAGIAAGLGVATGDSIYAALGLFGMAALVTEGGTLFHAIKVCGGLYLIGFGVLLFMRPGTAAAGTPIAVRSDAVSSFFRRGLVTDLANPQTVLFFASIFAVTLTPDTPFWAKAVSWLGIVVASALWRVGLSVALSHENVRRAYLRAQRPAERVLGGVLAAFGARLLVTSITDSRS